MVGKLALCIQEQMLEDCNLEDCNWEKNKLEDGKAVGCRLEMVCYKMDFRSFLLGAKSGSWSVLRIEVLVFRSLI